MANDAEILDFLLQHLNAINQIAHQHRDYHRRPGCGAQ